MAFDDLLAQASDAEAKLRRLQKKQTLATVTATEPPMSATPAAPSMFDDGILAFEEPDGSMAWGLRHVMNFEELGPPEGMPISASVLDGLARVAPQVAEAIRTSQFFELIGPPHVLEGLKNGTLELLPTKAGGLTGAVRAVQGTKKIVSNGVFRKAALTASLGPVLLTPASAALGQLHMLEIRRLLGRVEGKLDRVIEGQQAERHGKVFGSIDVVKGIAEAVAQGAAVTQIDMHKIASVDLDLRQVIAELEQLHRTYHQRAANPKSPSLSTFEDFFGLTRQVEIDDARLYLAACSALIILDELQRGHASPTDPASRATRDLALSASRNRLSSANSVLAHLKEFQQRCRQALDKDAQSKVRIFTGTHDRVSKLLSEDRTTVAELFSIARRMSADLEGENMVSVIRVDARRPELQVQVVKVPVEAPWPQ